MRILKCNDIFSTRCQRSTNSAHKRHILGDGDIVHKVPVPFDALSKENVSSCGYGNNVTVFTERFEGYWIMNLAC